MSSSISDSNDSSKSTSNTTVSITHRATASGKPAPDTDPSPSGPKQASSVWREFQDVTKKLFRHSRAYADIERTMERQSAMEAEVQAQKDRISHLESNQQNQMDGFEARYEIWRKEKATLEFEKKKAEDEMAAEHTRKMSEVERRLRREVEKADSLAKLLERVNTEASLAKKELAVCKDRLQEWDRYINLLKDVDFDSFAGKMNQLFRDCFSLVTAHFGIGLPSELLLDYSQWEKQVTELKLPLRFPPTNSPAAKLVRTAAALNIIATHLCANIFKPCYIPESAAGSETINEILQYQFGAQLRKEEKFTRALLTSMYSPERVRVAIDRVVRITLEDVLKQLGIFLVDGRDNFSAKLEKLLRKAAGLWQELQQSKMMVEASLGDEDSIERPGEYLVEFGKPISQAAPPEFEMLSLFPRIYVPEDNRVVHHGGFLWSDQEAVIIAEQELRDFKRTKDGRGMNGAAMRGSKRDRRQSTVMGGQTGSTSSSPSSLGVGKLSFSERELQRLRENVVHD